MDTGLQAMSKAVEGRLKQRWMSPPPVPHIFWFYFFISNLTDLQTLLGLGFEFPHDSAALQFTDTGCWVLYGDSLVFIYTTGINTIYLSINADLQILFSLTESLVGSEIELFGRWQNPNTTITIEFSRAKIRSPPRPGARPNNWVSDSHHLSLLQNSFFLISSGFAFLIC